MRPLRLVLPLLLTWACNGPVEGADGVERRVPAAGDLQQALNEARAGDRIVLEPGATYVGNFVLPVHEGSDYVTVTTEPAADLPPTGRRVTPDVASRLAKIQSPNTGPALRTTPRAHHWRLELIEFVGGRSSEVLLLGDGSKAQQTLSDVPFELVVDRCYFHGDDRTQKRAIALNSGRTSIIGSYITGIARPGQDSQAIGGWNGPGPYLIQNNHLEGAAENFMLGGSPPFIDGLIPTDVIFRQNFVTKPLEWREKKVTVKNLFELKNARRVLVEFNVFEYSWRSGQTGFAVVLTPRGERGRATWATVEDVTFRYNIVRHVGGGLNVLGRDDTGPSGQLRRLHVSHNVFYDIDGPSWGGSGAFLQIGAAPADVFVEHNTVLHSGTAISAYGGTKRAPVPIERFIFRNNLMRHNRYGVHGSGRAVGNDTLRVFFPDGLFAYNVLAGGKPSLYPPDNLFPSVEDFMRQFVAPETGDLRLIENSSFRGRASDGTDLGADVARINSGVPDEDPDRERRRPRPLGKDPIGPSIVGAALVAASFAASRLRN